MEGGDSVRLSVRTSVGYCATPRCHDGARWRVWDPRRRAPESCAVCEGCGIAWLAALRTPEVWAPFGGFPADLEAAIRYAAQGPKVQVHSPATDALRMLSRDLPASPESAPPEPARKRPGPPPRKAPVRMDPVIPAVSAPVPSTPTPRVAMEPPLDLALLEDEEGRDPSLDLTALVEGPDAPGLSSQSISLELATQESAPTVDVLDVSSRPTGEAVRPGDGGREARDDEPALPAWTRIPPGSCAAGHYRDLVRIIAANPDLRGVALDETFMVRARARTGRAYVGAPMNLVAYARRELGIYTGGRGLSGQYLRIFRTTYLETCTRYQVAPAVLDEMQGEVDIVAGEIHEEVSARVALEAALVERIVVEPTALALEEQRAERTEADRDGEKPGFITAAALQMRILQEQAKMREREEAYAVATAKSVYLIESLRELGGLDPVRARIVEEERFMEECSQDDDRENVISNGIIEVLTELLQVASERYVP